MALAPSEIFEIDKWAAEHKVDLDEAAVEKLGRYRDLIVAWSSRMNLVSKSDIPHIMTNHILDSLMAVPLIRQRSRVIDIGSGAGLPGIPLAIARVDIEMTLLESIHKKALFQRAVIRELELENVKVLESRLETVEMARAFDVATIRALPRLENQLERIQVLIRPGGMIIYYEKRGVCHGIHV